MLNFLMIGSNLISLFVFVCFFSGRLNCDLIRFL